MFEEIHGYMDHLMVETENCIEDSMQSNLLDSALEIDFDVSLNFLICEPKMYSEVESMVPIIATWFEHFAEGLLSQISSPFLEESLMEMTSDGIWFSIASNLIGSQSQVVETETYLADAAVAWFATIGTTSGVLVAVNQVNDLVENMQNEDWGLSDLLSYAMQSLSSQSPNGRYCVSFVQGDNSNLLVGFTAIKFCF